MAAILETKLFKLNSVSQDSLFVENSHTQTGVEFSFLHACFFFLTTREVPHNTSGSIFGGNVFKIFYLEWERTFFVALIEKLNTTHSLL